MLLAFHPTCVCVLLISTMRSFSSWAGTKFLFSQYSSFKNCPSVEWLAWPGFLQKLPYFWHAILQSGVFKTPTSYTEETPALLRAVLTALKDLDLIREQQVWRPEAQRKENKDSPPGKTQASLQDAFSLPSQIFCQTGELFSLHMAEAFLCLTQLCQAGWGGVCLWWDRLIQCFSTLAEA